MQQRPLPGAGTEVLDIDLAAPLADADVAELRDAFAHHGLLLFRDQHLSAERQTEVAAIFGPIQRESGQAISYVSNVRPDGIAPNGPLLFHSDLAFLAEPLDGISLYGMVVPASGAETLFADAVGAVDRLPDSLRATLEASHVRNASGFRVNFAERQQEADVHPDEISTLHPAIAPHPRTGRPVLMINECHSVRIVELSPEESASVLDATYEVLYADACVYAHRWRVGDFVVFDNIAVQHGRRTFDPLEARTLERVVLGTSTADFRLTPTLIDLYAGATAHRKGRDA